MIDSSLLWFLSCPFKVPDVEHFLSQWEHLNGLSPVWVLSRLFKWLEIEHLKSHWEQLNCFSMVWTLSFLFTLPDVEEREQLKGLSLFWVLSCVSSKSICVFCLPCWKLNWHPDILSVVLNYDPNVPKLSLAVQKKISYNCMLGFAIQTFRYSHMELFSHLGCLVCGILSFVFLIYSNAFLTFWHS